VQAAGVSSSRVEASSTAAPGLCNCRGLSPDFPGWAGPNRMVTRALLWVAKNERLYVVYPQLGAVRGAARIDHAMTSCLPDACAGAGWITARQQADPPAHPPQTDGMRRLGGYAGGPYRLAFARLLAR
jgi:hypothetical protein